jgi:hypothetical protein
MKRLFQIIANFFARVTSFYFSFYLGRPFQPAVKKAGHATLYLYRPFDIYQAGYSPTIKVQSITSFPLVSRGYKIFSLPPGTYHIEAPFSLLFWWKKTTSCTLELKADEIYFIRFLPYLHYHPYPGERISEVSGGMFHLVESSLALPEISKTQLIYENIIE